MRHPRSHWKTAAAALALAGALAVPAGRSAWGDDTDLFRTQVGKPYVFIVLDTSTSMNGSPANGWVAANGDDQGSKFQQVKQALFQVFNEIYLANGDVVHFGFSTFNQDNLRVQGKHWLYRVASVSSPLAIGYPVVGSTLTFGKHFALGAGTTDGVAGSCAAPLPLSTTADFAKVDRFSKLEPADVNNDGLADAYATTTLWVSVPNGANKGTYRIDVAQVPGSGDFRPASTFQAQFKLSKVTNANNCTLTSVGTATATLTYVNEFLMSDEVPTGSGNKVGSAVIKDCGNENTGEATAAVTANGWSWQDAQAFNTCGSPKPFSGAGWESNYDSFPLPSDAILTGQTLDVDPYACSPAPNVRTFFAPPSNPGAAKAQCSPPSYSLKWPTTGGSARALDSGDMIPFHWTQTHRFDFFRRLAPNYFNGATLADLEFRAAPFFRDVPDSRGALELKDDDQRPLIPYGASPLGGAVVDFRCWYLGSEDPKCKSSLQPFGTGWDDLAKQFDQDFGCRKPYLIVVGDGESHGNSNDPTSAVASLKKNLVQTWAIDYGGSCAPNGTYHSLTNAGNGTCISPQTQAELVDALRQIVGQIIEATKSFSSAAVPTVQADVADRIFLSNFTPLSDAVAPVWIGHMNGFLKPLPITAAGKPDTSAAAACPTSLPICATQADCPANSACSSTATGKRCVATGCFLWDAGAQLLQQVQPIATQLGPGALQRRVYYSELADGGQWAAKRHYFNQRSYGVDAQPIRFDFWRGLGLSFTTPEVSASTNLATQTTANQVVASALAKKSADLNNPHTATTGDDTPFVLGDIFHSSPVVVGSPVNTAYFASNVPGYRDFFHKHENRRKVLLVGANDGMLHAFDAGVYDKTKQLFGNGTGSEIFGFVPRSVLPTMTGLFANSRNRTWSVDGNVTVADVRIDPLYSGGTPDPAGTDGPEWRTVAIGGLREGGVGYYAVDMTQPDTLDASNNPQPGAGNYVPSCAGGDTASAVAGCGPVPYPAELWEFRDGIRIPDPATGQTLKIAQLDEDGNGVPDLAPGWSTPNIGRIRVLDGGTAVDKYVAVFGGGLDTAEQAGNWLYMVDIETGQTIYKQPLVGSAPAEPSAVDIDGDGYLDRIYIGTTQGFLYRVDLRKADNTVPSLVSFTSSVTSNGTTYTLAGKRITDAAFAPRIIFKAQPDATTPAASPRPIFYRASVIFIANLNNQFAIAFGTGDRNNLFSHDLQAGRFYVFRDDIAVGDRTTSYTEASLQAIGVDDAPLASDLLTTANSIKQGWFLSLNTDERLITNPFALSGVLIFTGFTPDPPPQGGGTCKRTGKSRIFAINATNGNGLLFDVYGTASRFTQIADFVTDPYTEQGQTKNPSLPTSRPNADQFPTGSHLADVMEQLKKLFPPSCKFGNFRIDIKTLSSDTGVIFIAPVPVCIIEKNWKEF